MAAVDGMTQGWSSNNVDITFTNCKAGPNSYMTFYGNPTNALITNQPVWYPTISAFLTSMESPTEEANYLKPVEEFMFTCEVSQ